MCEFRLTKARLAAQLEDAASRTEEVQATLTARREAKEAAGGHRSSSQVTPALHPARRMHAPCACRSVPMAVHMHMHVMCAQVSLKEKKRLQAITETTERARMMSAYDYMRLYTVTHGNIRLHTVTHDSIHCYTLLHTVTHGHTRLNPVTDCSIVLYTVTCCYRRSPR